MKERPILMNAFSVRGIFDDRKTKTRRIQGLEGLNDSRVTVHGRPLFSEEGYWQVKVDDSPYNFRCPYGVVGDRLWVKETWGAPDADHPRCKDGRKPQLGDRLVYRANPADDYQWGSGRPSQGSFCWRPSIFMPRWASRLLLEVKDIRVERVQEISGADVHAEGVNSYVHKDASYFERAQREAFSRLWDSINAKPKPAYARDEKGKKVIEHYVSYPWEDIQETRTHRGKPWYVIGNPWVFVVGFRSAAA